MDFSILGPLQVRTGSHTIRLTGSKQLALLSLLLIRPGTTIPTDRIAAALWPDGPANDSNGAVRFHIWKLRSALGDRGAAPAVIITADRGYRLAADALDIDAGRFCLALETARHFVTHNPEQALGHLSDGLSLWHGDPLVDVAYEEFAQAEIRRLNALRTDAELLRIDAMFALERHREVLADLEALTETHPFAEEFWEQLMVGFHATGRCAQAVTAFARMEHRFRAELDMEPSPRLRRLRDRIATGKDLVVLANEP